MKSVKGKILIVIIGVLFSFSFFILMIYVFAWGHAFKKNYLNRPPANGEKVYRIVCLGESTTDGQYPWHLQEVLNTRAQGRRFHVIDKGHAGCNTDYIMENLQYYIAEYQPDMIVAMMGINDRSDALVVCDSSAGGWYRRLTLYKFLKVLRFQLRNAYVLGGYYGKQAGGNPSELGESISASENPSNEQELILTGEQFSHKKRYQEAEVMFAQAIKMNPRSARAYLGMGEIFRLEKRYKEAEKMLHRSIEFFPQKGDAYIALCDSLRAERRYREAESIVQKALKINPRDDRVYIELGKIYWDEQRSREAEKMFRKALDVNPQSAQAFIELGRMFFQENKYCDAEAMFLQGAKCNPLESQAYIELAKVKSLRKDRESAKEEFPQEISNEQTENAIDATLIINEEPHHQEYYGTNTKDHYRRLKSIVLGRGIKLMCVQYPRCHVKPLIELLGQPGDGVVFIDNEKSFNEGVSRDGYDAYFTDRCYNKISPNFGHCTYRGNRLLAENIADAIVVNLHKTE